MPTHFKGCQQAVTALNAFINLIRASDSLIGRLTLQLEGMRPRLGSLDYHALLTRAQRLGPGLPLMLEHLPREDYAPATVYVGETARELGLTV